MALTLYRITATNKLVVVDSATPPSGGVAVTLSSTGNLVDTAPWTRTLDASTSHVADWHPAKYPPSTPEMFTSEAQLLSLNSSSQAFTYNGLNVLTPTVQSVIFTTKLQNIVDPVVWTSSPTGLLTSTSDAGATLTSANFGANTSVTVTATAGTNSDVITIVRLTDGATVLVGYLTNESHTLPSDSSGAVTVYTGATGTFKVYYGLTDVTSACTFAGVGVNCAGSVTVAGVYTVSSGIATGTDLSTYTLTATHPTYGAITKVFSISKSKAGVSAVISDLSNDNHTVPTDSSGSNGNFTGCATTMSVFLGSSDDSANWTYAVTKSAGVTCTEAITSRTQTVTAMTTDTGTVTIVASKSGFASQTQVFSISKAKSGVAYRINLSDNSVRKSSAGVLSPTSLTLTASKIDVSGVTAYTGRFKIYLNGSATATYTSAADEASKAYTVTATDTTIKCELYLAGGTTTLVDTETVLVVVDGGNGVSINVVELYQQAASPPALPTGTSYDFSTDTLSGTLGSWIRTMPASSTVPTYMTVCTFTVTAPTTSQTRTVWSAAVIAAQNGTVLNIDPSVTYSFAGSVPTGAGFTFTLSNCTAASSNGGTSVALTSTADPYVVLSGLSLNPVDNYIIALRVKIPIGTGIDGNLFYANSSHSYIEGVNKLSMAGLIGTGDWQTIVVDASNTTSDWLTGGTVTGLRFDFVHAIATINLAYISIGKYGISKGARATFTAYAAVASAAWNDATAYAAITGMTGSGGSLLIGDEVTLCYPSVAAATYVITRYVTAVGNPGTWVVRGQVIDGNLMVTGTLSAASLKTSNLSAATAITVGTATNGLILSSVDNTLKVIQNSATRVNFGNLVGTYGIEGFNSASTSVFKLNENGLDAKITQSALKLIGCSYRSQIVLEGDYTFTIYGSAVQTVVIPIPISTVGMYQLFARVTAYWENDLSGSSSYASHALWREMSMGVYYKNAYTTSGGGNDISKVISMGEVRQGDDTTDDTYFPYTKIKLQVNSVTAANLVVGTDYTITTVGTTNWNTVSGGDLITPYLINSSFRAAVAGTGTGVATTGNPEISLSNRVGNSTATNTTTFSYTILALDNKMYPFEVF